MLNLNTTLNNFFATEAKMKNVVASENKNVYLNMNIFTLTIYLDQAFTLPFRSVLSLYRN